MRWRCCRRCCWFEQSTSSNRSLQVSLSSPNVDLIARDSGGADSDGAESFTTATSIDDDLYEAPTFNNFSEFLNYNTIAKRRIPISITEAGFLKELMEEPSLTWSVAARRPGMEVQKKIDKSSPNVLVRCFCEYDEVLPLAFLYNLVEADRRRVWDNMFTDFRVLENCGDGKDMVYFMLPAPAPIVASRDFVLHRRVVIENTPEGKRYSLLQRSAVHAAKPETRGVVRAENIIGGYSFLQKTGTSKISVFVASMSDPKGKVPAFVVNAMASKKLVSWIDSLYRASKQCVDAEMLESWVQKYSEV